MHSETLRNVKTMRQIKTGYDLVRKQRIRTTNSLSRTEEEAAHLLSLNDKRVEHTLAKETKRFAAMEASVEKSRQRLLKARAKLAATVNRNQALTELRYELQRARWEKSDHIPMKKEPPTTNGSLPRTELYY